MQSVPTIHQSILLSPEAPAGLADRLLAHLRRIARRWAGTVDRLPNTFSWDELETIMNAQGYGEGATPEETTARTIDLVWLTLQFDGEIVRDWIQNQNIDKDLWHEVDEGDHSADLAARIVADIRDRRDFEQVMIELGALVLGDEDEGFEDCEDGDYDGGVE